MPVDVLTEIVIDRLCAQVASYAADPSDAPRWYANIESVAWVTPPPVGLGSRMDFVARFLGRRLAYTYEVVVFEPGPATGDANRAGAVPDADHLHLAARGRRTDPDDAA